MSMSAVEDRMVPASCIKMRALMGHKVDYQEEVLNWGCSWTYVPSILKQTTVATEFEINMLYEALINACLSLGHRH